MPRLIYGLEVQNLRKKDIQLLETFQIRCTKQLQSLPLKTSNSAALALFGLLPIGACIDKNILTLFCNIAWDPQCTEYDIALRQMAVKKSNDLSLFSKVRNTLESYALPSAYQLLGDPPSKDQWKNIIKTKIRVLTRILKIGVKRCRPEKVGVLPYFSIETFQKVGVRNEKLE